MQREPLLDLASPGSPPPAQWRTARHGSRSSGHGDWARAAQLLAAIVVPVAWVGVSSLAILVNKHIMVDISFRHPVFVAWLGLLTTTCASAAVVRLGLPPSQRVTLSRRAYLTRVLPTGFCMALTFHTGNMAYLYLTVAFVQMLKALCPVITMLLLFAFRLERPTTRLILSVCVISAGVALASWGELNLSLFGLTSMLTSVVAESVRLVLTQHLLVGTSQQMHPFEGLMFIGSACTACLTVQGLVWELGPMLRHQSFLKVVAHPTHFVLCATAGFGVNALAILTIKLTSSLTLKVLGTVKDALLVTVGVIFLREQVTHTQLSGYSLSVAGFLAYNYIKATGGSADGAAKHAQPLLPMTNAHAINGTSSASGASSDKDA